VSGARKSRNPGMAGPGLLQGPPGGPYCLFQLLGLRGSWLMAASLPLVSISIFASATVSSALVVSYKKPNCWVQVTLLQPDPILPQSHLQRLSQSQVLGLILDISFGGHSLPHYTGWWRLPRQYSEALTWGQMGQDPCVACPADGTGGQSRAETLGTLG
jgi:hypothetical protein